MDDLAKLWLGFFGGKSHSKTNDNSETRPMTLETSWDVIFAQIVEIVNEALPIPKPGPFVWNSAEVHRKGTGEKQQGGRPGKQMVYIMYIYIYCITTHIYIYTIISICNHMDHFVYFKKYHCMYMCIYSMYIYMIT